LPWLPRRLVSDFILANVQSARCNKRFRTSNIRFKDTSRNILDTTMGIERDLRRRQD